MDRKKILLWGILIAGLFSFSIPVFALEIGKQEINITATDSFVSRYIWRGQDLYADNDGAYQPSIDIALPKALAGADLSFNVWGSYPLSSGHEKGEELDYTVSLSKDIYDGLNLGFGYTYFDYPKANNKTDVQEPWMSFALNILDKPSVTFNAFAGYDFQVTSGGPDEGWYYSWGFDVGLPLPEADVFQKEQTLDLGVTNWGTDGAADLEPSSLYATEFSASTTYNFKYLSITPGIHYTINHEDKINSGKDEIWWSMELTYAF